MRERGRTERCSGFAVHEVRKQSLGDGVSQTIKSSLKIFSFLLHEKFDQLAGADHLGLLPSIREMLLVTRDQIIRLTSLGTLKEHVVVGIGTLLNVNAWLDP